MHLLILTLALAAEPQPQRMEWTVDGLKREGLVVAPEKLSPGGAPLVFAFHGHGGSMQNAAKQMAIHTHWPEALVVYLQGVPTPTPRDPKGEKPGWQIEPGAQGDRDLKLVDTVLTTVQKKHQIDPRRIYATGFSNGGRFTYVLWASRPNVFAAYAPNGSPATVSEAAFKPAPVFHIAGEKDEVAKFDLQKQTIEAVKKLNGCAAEGTEWAKMCTLYPSKTGTPLVTMIHPGGHVIPKEAPALIVKFFREHERKP
jgi:polyhydroxybutyrate depolymerase